MGIHNKLKKSLEKIVNLGLIALSTTLPATAISCTAPRLNTAPYNNASLQQRTEDKFDTFKKEVSKMSVDAGSDQEFLETLEKKWGYVLLRPGNNQFRRIAYQVLDGDTKWETDADAIKYIEGILAIVAKDNDYNQKVSHGDFIAFVDPEEVVKDKKAPSKTVAYPGKIYFTRHALPNDIKSIVEELNSTRGATEVREEVKDPLTGKIVKDEKGNMKTRVDVKASDQKFFEELESKGYLLVTRENPKYHRVVRQILYDNFYMVSADTSRYVRSSRALAVKDTDSDGKVSRGDLAFFVEPKSWQLDGIFPLEILVDPITEARKVYLEPVTEVHSFPENLQTETPLLNPFASGDAYVLMGLDFLRDMDTERESDNFGYSLTARINLPNGFVVRGSTSQRDQGNFFSKDSLLEVSRDLSSVTGYTGFRQVKSGEGINQRAPDALTEGTSELEEELTLRSIIANVEYWRVGATFAFARRLTETTEFQDLMVTPLDANGNPLTQPIPVRTDTNVEDEQLLSYSRLQYLLAKNLAVGTDIQYAVANVDLAVKVNGNTTRFDDKRIATSLGPFAQYITHEFFGNAGIKAAKVIGRKERYGLNAEMAVRESDFITGVDFNNFDNSTEGGLTVYYKPSAGRQDFFDLASSRRTAILLRNTQDMFIPETTDALERSNFLNLVAQNRAYGVRIAHETPEGANPKVLKWFVGIPVPYLQEPKLTIYGTGQHVVSKKDSGIDGRKRHELNGGLGLSLDPFILNFEYFQKDLIGESEDEIGVRAYFGFGINF